MLRFIEFDNVKKIAKVTRLSKRLIRFADGLDYDLGLNGKALCIATDADEISLPHVEIERKDYGERFRVYMINFSKGCLEFKYFDNQSEAFMFALMWLSEQRRS